MFGTLVEKRAGEYQEPCAGDSGGPLMYKTDGPKGRWVVIGWGYKTCLNQFWEIFGLFLRLIDIRVLDVRGLDVRGWTLGVWTFGVEPRTSVFRRSGFGVRGSYQYPKMVKKTPNVRTPNVQTPNVRTPNVRKHHRSKN